MRRLYNTDSQMSKQGQGENYFDKSCFDCSDIIVVARRCNSFVVRYDSYFWLVVSRNSCGTIVRFRVSEMGN